MSKILLDYPIYHNLPLIFNYYFFKVQITMHTSVFTIPSYGSCSGAKLVDFYNIFEKSHKKEWKIQNPKMPFSNLPNR